MTRRKAFSNELSDSYPTADAISAKLLVFADNIIPAALTIRHWVR